MIMEKIKQQWIKLGYEWNEDRYCIMLKHNVSDKEKIISISKASKGYISYLPDGTCCGLTYQEHLLISETLDSIEIEKEEYL